MTEDFKDFLAEEAEKITESSTIEISNKVAAAAKKLLLMKEEYSKKEEQLEQLKKEIDILESQTIPEMLQDAGLKGITLPNGKKISIDDRWFISCKKDCQGDLYQWFLNNGYSDYVKKVVQIPVNDIAELKVLQARCEGYDISLQETLPHSKTMEKFFRDLLENNEQIPTELLNAYQKKITKIK